MVATVAVEVDKKMMAKITKRLRKLPADFVPVMDRMLIAVEGEVRKESPRDTGTGARGWRTIDTKGRAFDLEGSVVNPLVYMAVQDIGREPGSAPPPPQALAGWARRHGFTGSLFVLARAIGQKGWRGRGARKNRGYVKRSLKNVVPVVNGIINAWARGIRW